MSALELRRHLAAMETAAQELAAKARECDTVMELEEVETLLHDLVSAFADLKVNLAPPSANTRH